MRTTEQRFEHLRRRGKVLFHEERWAGRVALVRLTRPMLAYKKVRAFAEGGWYAFTVAHLRIPKGALVSTSGGSKLRASRAVVLGFGRKGMKEGRSIHDINFKYQLGRTVHPRRGFDEDAGSTCSSGIHFYLTLGGARRH